MSMRPTIRRATVATAAAALAVGLLPAVATSADAAGASPNVYVSFIARHQTAPVAGDGALKSNAPTDLAGAASTVVGNGTYVDSYDASPDGSVAAYVLTTRDDTVPYLDKSHGLVVVAGGVARQVASLVDGNPVVSKGSTKTYVYWFSDGALRRYDVVARTQTTIPAFAPVLTSTVQEYAVGLAVSEDQTQVAAVYNRYDANGAFKGRRLKAASLSSPTTLTYSTFSATYPLPSTSTLAFVGTNTLLYSVALDAGSSFDTKVATLAPAASPVAAVAGPGDYYDVRKAGGKWYVWRDSGSPVVSEVAEVDDPLTFDPAVATWSQHPDSVGSQRYIPTTGALPALPALSTTKAPSTSLVLFDRTTVSTNGRPYFLAGSYTELYGTGQNFRGQMRYSTDQGATWKVLGTTTGTNQLGPDGFYNGRTQALTRNTWFRWYYGADLLSTAVTSPITKVFVTPTITVLKAKSGTRTKVYGTVARTGGTAILYRKSSTGSLVKIAQVTVTSAGAYSFGYRSLSRGTYRVTVLATKTWAANFKSFTV